MLIKEVEAGGGNQVQKIQRFFKDGYFKLIKSLSHPLG